MLTPTAIIRNKQPSKLSNKTNKCVTKPKENIKGKHYCA